MMSMVKYFCELQKSCRCNMHDIVFDLLSYERIKNFEQVGELGFTLTAVNPSNQDSGYVDDFCHVAHM